MFGMKGVIIHMDALRMEIFKGYRIYLPETGLGVIQLTKQECHKYLFAESEKENVIVIKQPVQQSLF